MSSFHKYPDNLELRSGDIATFIYIEQSLAVVINQELKMHLIVSSPGSPSPCFVASVVFGERANETEVLRKTRDLLAKYGTFRLAIMFYYWASPCIADWLRKRPRMSYVARILLMPVVMAAHTLNKGLLRKPRHST